MEQEELSLFVIFRDIPIEPYLENNKEVRTNDIRIKRVSIRKQIRDEAANFQRINVEFDYLNKSEAYVVLLRTESISSHLVDRTGFHFCGIFETQDEAIKFTEVVKEGSWKDFAIKKEKFLHCDVIPCVLTDK